MQYSVNLRNVQANAIRTALAAGTLEIHDATKTLVAFPLAFNAAENGVIETAALGPVNAVAGTATGFRIKGSNGDVEITGAVQAGTAAVTDTVVLLRLDFVGGEAVTIEPIRFTVPQ